MVDHDEVLEVIHETLTELSSMCPQTLFDVYGTTDGFYVADFKTQEAENQSYLTEPSDPQEYISEALDRWGDRKFPRWLA